MGETKEFKVMLTEDQVVAVANLVVTLVENMDGLKELEDFEGGSSVGTMVEAGLESLQALMKQLPM